jgi:hypothetical protein
MARLWAHIIAVMATRSSDGIGDGEMTGFDGKGKWEALPEVGAKRQVRRCLRNRGSYTRTLPSRECQQSAGLQPGGAFYWGRLKSNPVASKFGRATPCVMRKDFGSLVEPRQLGSLTFRR